MNYGLRRLPVFRKRFPPKVTVTHKVNENREGVEVEEVPGYVAAYERTLAEANAADAVAGEAFTEATLTEIFDFAAQAEFDAMSPADQAIQVLAGADPESRKRARITKAQSIMLKAALDEARRWQEAG